MAQNFELGQVVVTAQINEYLETDEMFQEEIARAIWQYKHKRWGSTCEADAKLNDEALEIGDRVVAKYETCKGNIFIITEWDRSVTTILFTHEY